MQVNQHQGVERITSQELEDKIIKQSQQMRDHFKKIHTVIRSFQDNLNSDSYNQVIKPFQELRPPQNQEVVPEPKKPQESAQECHDLRDSQIQAKYEKMIRELSEESLQDNSQTSDSLRPQVLDYTQLESFKDETLMRSFQSSLFSEKRDSKSNTMQVFNYTQNTNQISNLFKKEKSNKSPLRDFDSPFKFPTLKSTPPDSQLSDYENQQENLLQLEDSMNKPMNITSPDFKENLLDVMLSQETGYVKIQGLIQGENQQSFQHFDTQVQTKQNSPLKIQHQQFFNSTHEVQPLQNNLSFENLLNEEQQDEDQDEEENLEEKIQFNEYQIESETDRKENESPFLNQIYKNLNRKCKENLKQNVMENDYSLFLNKSQQNSDQKKKKINNRYNSSPFSKHNQIEESPQISLEVPCKQLEEVNPVRKSRSQMSKFLTQNRQPTQMKSRKASQNISFNDTSLVQEGQSFIEYKNSSVINYRESHFSSVQSSVSKKKLKKNNSNSRSKTPMNRSDSKNAGVVQIQRKIQIDQQFREEKKEKLNKKLQRIEELNKKKKLEQDKLVIKNQQKQKEKSLGRRPQSALNTTKNIPYSKKKLESTQTLTKKEVQKPQIIQPPTYSSLFRKKSIDSQVPLPKQQTKIEHYSRSRSKMNRTASQPEEVQKVHPVPKLDMTQIKLQQELNNKKVSFNQPQKKQSRPASKQKTQVMQQSKLFQKNQNWKPVIGSYKGSQNISPEKLNLCHIKYN